MDDFRNGLATAIALGWWGSWNIYICKLIAFVITWPVIM
jgi:hypothetical protein